MGVEALGLAVLWKDGGMTLLLTGRDDLREERIKRCDAF